MVSVTQQPQFLRRLHNRPALRRRSGLVVFLQLALVASGVGVGGALAYLAHRATADAPTFRVQELELSEVPEALRADVASRLNWALGRNLLTADLDRIRRAAESVPEVAAARVRRLLPAALEVEVDVREAAARLVTPDRAWAVSVDGVVLRSPPAEKLPVILVDVAIGDALADDRHLPTAVDAAFARAIAVHDALRPIPDAPPLEVVSVRLDPRGSVVTLAHPALQILADDPDGLREKILALPRMPGMGVGAGALIDLRYPDMMIVTAPANSGE